MSWGYITTSGTFTYPVSYESKNSITTGQVGGSGGSVSILANKTLTSVKLDYNRAGTSSGAPTSAYLIIIGY